MEVLETIINSVNHTFHIYQGRFCSRIKEQILSGQLLLLVSGIEVVGEIGLELSRGQIKLIKDEE